MAARSHARFGVCVVLAVGTISCLGVGAGRAGVDEPFPAHQVMGNVYYVGSKALATYLIATPEGHVLI